MNEINYDKSGVFTYHEVDYDFNYFTDIDIKKKASFVVGVVNSLISEDHYQSILKNLIFYFRVIDVFSDALTKISDEDKTFSLIEIEDIVLNTNIIDIILANVKDGLIDELSDAVDKDIEYKTGIHKNYLNEAVAKLVETLEQRMKNVDIESLMGFADVFRGISSDNMTPEKLWDAYSRSEAFKSVRAEIQEKSKNQNDMANIFVDEIKKQQKRGRKQNTKKKEIVNDQNEGDIIK